MESISPETIYHLQVQCLQDLGYDTDKHRIVDSMCSILHLLSDIGFDPKRDYTEVEIEEIRKAIEKVLKPYFQR